MATDESNEVVTRSFSPQAHRYLEALEGTGVTESEDGHVSEEVLEVLRALHHVLGGGMVRIELVSEGTSSLVQDLDGRLQEMAEYSPQCEAGLVCF